jgi:hypothetical protein
MLVDASFPDLTIAPEDLAQAPPVDLDGEAIPDGLPERFERMLASNARVRETWESTTYPSLSEQAFALMGVLGACGLTKTEAAAVHVGLYERHGRKEDGIRKVPYSLKAWVEGRAWAEARERNAGIGAAPEREPGEPGPETGEPASGDGRPREGGVEQNAAGPFRPLSEPADAFLGGEIRPVVWAVKGIWPAGVSGIIGGPEKCGKTWLAHELALALSTGAPFLGSYAVPRPLRVLVWEEEDGTERTRRRGRQLLAGRNRPIPSPNLLRYLVGHGLKLDSKHGLSRLEAELGWFKPEIVILGNLREVHGKDENRPEMAHVRDALRRLSKEHGCPFVVIHHFRKTQADQNRRGSQMLAGSGIWGAWVEAWLWVTPGDSEDISILEVGSKDAPGVGRLVVQRRDLTDREPLARDEDGNAVWSVLLAEVERKDRGEESRGRILAAVKDHHASTGGPASVKDLERLTGLSRRTIVARLPELEAAGLVQEVKLHRNAKGYVPGA